MFCPKCGNRTPDGAAFCGACGARLAQPQAAQPVRAPQPARAAQPTPPPAPRKKNSGKTGTLVLVTTIISLLLIIFSIAATLNTAFYKIPAISLVMTLADGRDDVDYLLDSMDYAIEEMEDDLDYQEDMMDDDEVEAAEKMIESVEKLRRAFSIHNTRVLVKLVEDIDNDLDIGIDREDLNEIKLVLNVAVVVIIGFFVLPVLFAVLAGVKKSAGLTIAGMVFTAISQLILSGLLWAVLSLAVGILQVMLCKQQKTAKIPA